MGFGLSIPNGLVFKLTGLPKTRGYTRYPMGIYPVETRWVVGRVCFLAAPFQIGYSYPFPEFTQHFFTLTGLSYNKAMPMLSRVLYTLEQIIRDEGLDFNISEPSRLYNLVSHGSHRFLFKAKPQQPLPLLKTTKNDTCWRNHFFFVRRNTIP
ncbi:hypothetical protein Hanom_Chr01g00078241 [Helianthus anomalus]